MKRTTPYLQLLPTWSLLGLFFLIPLAIVFLLSFRPSDEFGDPDWPASECWKRMFQCSTYGSLSRRG